MKKVMCKNNSLSGAHALQLGEVYNVLGETDTHYNIRSVRGHHDWYKKENFERVMAKGRKYDTCTKDSLGFYTMNCNDHTVEGSKVMKYIGTDVEYMTKGKNYNVKDGGDGFYRVLVDDGTERYIDKPSFTDPSNRERDVDEALAKSKMAEKHPHYYANVKNLEFIDVYDVIELFGVKNACLQHVLKKIMVIGNRGHKNHDTDLQDIYDTLDRYKIMRGELHNEEG